jgi:DNA-binding HxlR family transcriptional regulator
MPTPSRTGPTARARHRPSADEPPHRQWTPLARALTIAGDNWTLAIVAELASGRARLSTLRARLAGVSAGVLDRYLQRMAAAGLITRSRYREMPPRVELELTEAGHELLPVAAALSRWGLRRAWSDPTVRERVDPEALLRQLPLLLDLRSPLPDARVELGLTDAPAGPLSWVFDLRAGVCSPPGALQRARGAVNATIAGDEQAWTRALGPAADPRRLTLSGDRALARALLASLGSPSPAGRRKDAGR